MKALKAIRLILWMLIASASLAIVIAYTFMSRTILDESWLQETAQATTIYDTIREDVIAPQITTAAQQTDYTAVVDAKFAETLVAETFDDKTLAQLTAPVIAGTFEWLDHKSDRIEFTIDAKDQIDTMVDAFADKVAEHVVALPDCNWLSTLEDIQQARCKLPFATEDAVRGVVQTAANTNDVLRTGLITDSSFTIAESTRESANRIPEYINQFYAATIFATGVLIMTSIWLILKHRLVGLTVMGAGGILASLVLSVGASYLSRMPADFALEDSYRSILQSATDAFLAFSTPWLWTIGGAGLTLGLVSTGLRWLLRTRAKRKPQPQLSDSDT